MLIPYTLVPNDSDPGNQKTTIVAMANDTRIMIAVFSKTFFIVILISSNITSHFMDRSAM